MATNKISGKKRSLEEVINDDDDGKADISATDSQPLKKRKIFIENNVIHGIDISEDNDIIVSKINKLTSELLSYHSNYVLICNIDPVIEHCDIIDLISSISYPISLNYFRGTLGKAWLKFDTHQIALKIIKKLNGFELENKKLIAGLIENTPKYIDLKHSLKEYNIAKNRAYPKHKNKSKLNGKKKSKQKIKNKSKKTLKKTKNKKQTVTSK